MSYLERLADFGKDVAIGLLSRRMRSILAIAAFGVSSCGLVLARGVSETASSQISEKLTSDSLNEVRAVSSGADVAGGVELGFPSDVEERVERIDRVRSAGRRLILERSAAPLSRLNPGSASFRTHYQVGVAGITEGWLQAQEVELRPAHAASTFNSPFGARTALVGSDAAVELGIVGPGSGVKVWVGPYSFDVVAIAAKTPVSGDIDGALLIPYDTLRRLYQVPDSSAELLVRTVQGAARQVADVLPYAIRPEQPGTIKASAPPDLRRLRRGVETDLDRLILVVSVMALGVGCFGIANSMVVSVMTRTPEIGLRRALGASRKDISLIFLAEGALQGALGGLTGATTGVIGLLAISSAQKWSPVLSPGLVPVGVLAGASVGLLAAAYPSLRAARVDPATAVKHDA